MIVEFKEPGFKREQSPETVRKILAEAIEGEKDVLLTQLESDGEAIVNGATPVAIDEGYLKIEAGECGFYIELAQIVDVEIVL
jgi:hypothetical protein